jgi:hypothetical protein
MGDLCRLFSRSTELNIAIYIISVIFIILSGGFWIHGSNQTEQTEIDVWKKRASITAVIGIIVVSLLMAGNLIYYELAFNKKCDVFEQYLMRQKAELTSRLNPEAVTQNLAKGASRVVAETLATEFKNQFGRAVLEQLKKEIGKELPNLSSLLNQK